MKPLALEWFRKHEMLDAYYVGGSYVPHAIIARDKRFADAELAAEFQRTDCAYWRLEADALSSGDPMSLDTQMRLTKELNAMYRFATHPHRD